MKKKVLIMGTSPRVGGNSNALAMAFEDGAVEAGHDVERVTLAGKKISFCTGCWKCLDTQRCVIHDDADEIVQKMKDADVLVFATPIYYYEMSGQMKVLLDRANALYKVNYKYREVYLLTTAEDDKPATPVNAENGLKGWVSCFPKAKFIETVFAGNCLDIGAIKGHKALHEAKELGLHV
ncbi:flavodoxin family protein [Megasphaera hominis]|jgi:multimeric flavodoxin WrbA|uniref:Flavodoxin family protein n=1 Tax=Megasphaera hominis TaxID=159836 RepID=A0ABR6VK87_9FIRM|nr:flavodoxin family protein [Megasphaera hominis]MBC3537704.1 flavodoxin family protein [Megasphaera hominis]